MVYLAGRNGILDLIEEGNQLLGVWSRIEVVRIDPEPAGSLVQALDGPREIDSAGADSPRAELGVVLWYCWGAVPWRGSRII